MVSNFKRFFIIFSVLCITVIGIIAFFMKDDIEENKNQLTGLSGNMIDMNEITIPDVLKQMGFHNASVGCDEKGNTVVWINLMETVSFEEQKRFKVFLPTGYYHAFIAKKIFETIPNIHAIWIYHDGDIYNFFTYVTYDTYKHNGLLKASSNEKKFYKTSVPIEKLVDFFWSPQDLGNEMYFDSTHIAIDFQKLYKTRLLDMSVGGASSESVCINLNINGYPESEDKLKELSVEIAKAFVLSVGRYETQHWNGITWTKITYLFNENKLLETTMYIDGFREWLKSGFNPYEWVKLCEINVYDPNLNITNVINESFLRKEPSKLSYQQVRNKLLGMTDLEIKFLGVSTEGINAVVKVDGYSREDIWRKQMEKAETLMQMPLESIWFISEYQNEIIMAFIDREKYNVLTFMNQEGDFDILPGYWPKMAKKYWEINSH